MIIQRATDRQHSFVSNIILFFSHKIPGWMLQVKFHSKQPGFPFIYKLFESDFQVSFKFHL